jgi:replicative DNA helicase
MLDASARLDPIDFWLPDHARIATLVWARIDAKQAVWKHELKKAAPELADALDKLLADPGEREQKAEPIAAHLRALARRRRKYETLSRAASQLADGNEEAADEHVLNVASEHTEQRAAEYMDARETVQAALDEYKRSQTEGSSRRTGFGMLDDTLGNLRAKTLTVVGGTTGSGKSSLLLAMALNQSKWGLPVGIISLEDPEAVWGERVYAHAVSKSIEGSDPSDNTRALDVAKRARVHFAYELGRPLADVLRACRHLVRRHGCQVIYVDYLQAIGDPQSKERRHFVANAAARIKAQCQELGATLVLASQLSRPSKEKPFGEVYTSDLKESGDIENMAEVVMLLWRTGDKDDSLTLGKLAKVKWAPGRPRFRIHRNEVGSITRLGAPPQKKPTAQASTEGGYDSPEN